MPNYLVLEPNSIVALDLTQSIQELDPGASVVLATSTAEAMALMEQFGPPAVAFVHANPALVQTTQLGALLVKHATICIYMGHAAESTDAEVLVMDWPFSLQSVADILARLPSRVVHAPC